LRRILSKAHLKKAKKRKTIDRFVPWIEDRGGNRKVEQRTRKKGKSEGARNPLGSVRRRMMARGVTVYLRETLG